MPRYKVYTRAVTTTLPPPPADEYPLFGGSARTAKDWDDKQTLYSPAVTRCFLDDNDQLSLTDDVAARVVNSTRTQALVISFKVMDEASVKAALLKMAADPARRYYVTYYHEPENIPAATFVANCKTLRRWWVEIGGPANVKLGLILMGFTYRSKPADAEAYFGDNTVTVNAVAHPVHDYVGADQYDPGLKTGGYSDVARINKELVAFAVGKGLPIVFGEIGSGVGPSRVTDLVKRRAWIKAFADWCVSNAGTGPGKVEVACYWDVVAVKFWQTTDPERAVYGSIPRSDFSLDLDPPVLAIAPGSKAGEVAYGGPDPETPLMWRDYCRTSRFVHNIS